MTNRGIRSVVGVILLLLFLASFGGTFYLWQTAHRSEILLQQLADTVDAAPAAAQQNDTTAEDPLAALARQNPDFVGWLRLPDAGIDHPVMWTPTDPERYLRADFYGNYSYGGVPFLAAYCQPEPPSQNLIIHGHHMLNGTQFAGLLQYRDAAFCAAHPTLQFNTLTQTGTYRVVAVLSVNSTTRAGTLLYQSDFTDPTVFSAWQQTVADLTLYPVDIDTDLPADGQYLTLSTCRSALRRNSSRFLVIALRTEA